MVETIYKVNGVEYTDKKEAEAAAKKLELEEAKKKAEALEKAQLVETKKAEAKAIEDAFAKLRNVENTAGADYQKAMKEAKEAYVKAANAAKTEYTNKVAEAEKAYQTLKNDFIKKYGSYHMSYFNNGTSQEISISDILDDAFAAAASAFNLLGL